MSKRRRKTFRGVLVVALALTLAGCGGDEARPFGGDAGAEALARGRQGGAGGPDHAGSAGNGGTAGVPGPGGVSGQGGENAQPGANGGAWGAAGAGGAPARVCYGEFGEPVPCR